MSIRTFEFTYRCPACRKDTKGPKPGAFRHRTCAQSKRPPLMVLVEIDGEDVSRPTDPKPLGAE